MSTTGPQTRLRHSCGVANVSTTGLVAEDVGEIGAAGGPSAGGCRVSMAVASPPTSASVAVWTLIAGCPGHGGPAAARPTFIGAGLVISRRPSRRAMRDDDCLPPRPNGTSAT